MSDESPSATSTVADHAPLFKELASRIRELRKQAGYTQRDMASFGFSVRHWQQIEAGRPITVTTLLRISEAFKIKPEGTGPAPGTHYG